MSGLMFLAIIFPDSMQILAELILLSFLTFAWMYAYTSSAARHRMILFTILIVIGWIGHGVYIFYRWKIWSTRRSVDNDLGFVNAIVQTVISCPAAAYILAISWYRKIHELPVVPDLGHDIESQRPLTRTAEKDVTLLT